MTKLANNLRPIHPGEMLREDILPGANLSVSAAAKRLGVSRQMLNDIVCEKRPLSAAMCLRIAKLFGSTPDFWMRLQATYDLKKAAADKAIAKSISRIEPVSVP
jgi:addiction module HigA family antidote